VQKQGLCLSGGHHVRTVLPDDGAGSCSTYVSLSYVVSVFPYFLSNRRDTETDVAITREIQAENDAMMSILQLFFKEGTLYT
jgi:hypothetical protein